MPLPAKLIQAWRSGMCLGSLIKLLQSQRPDLATAVNDRWVCGGARGVGVEKRARMGAAGLAKAGCGKRGGAQRWVNGWGGWGGEVAALEELDQAAAKAAVTAASRMPLPAKLSQTWRSGLGSLIKLLQSQRPDLATAVNDRWVVSCVSSHDLASSMYMMSLSFVCGGRGGYALEWR
jgi:hypothetical protein